MNPAMPRDGSPIGNPFSTRYTSPSACDFLFPSAGEADRLITMLRQSDWWGQIVGPHGSGKSTLLHTLAPALKRAGRSIVFCTLHRSERRLPVDRTQVRSWDDSTQLIVDGYEQLSWLRRNWLKRKCRARQTGLLVTAHRCMGLPLLWQTETSGELAWQIVERLLDDSTRDCISRSDVSQAYSDHQGDLRETLMTLYDWYEARMSRG
jgi:hypothetical protein